jgi:hypothetical protein
VLRLTQNINNYYVLVIKRQTFSINPLAKYINYYYTVNYVISRDAVPPCIGERQHDGRDFAEGPPLVLPVDIDLSQALLKPFCKQHKKEM